MRRITFALLGTATVLVLLFSYRTSLGAPPAGSPPAALGSPAAPTATSAAGDRGGGTVTGAAVNTRWGVVQVQLTVSAGKVTAARTVRVPDANGHDRQVNSHTVPILDQEAVAAQSANIDGVSGATVTSDGYISSLQSAIDQAHLS